MKGPVGIMRILAFILSEMGSQWRALKQREPLGARILSTGAPVKGTFLIH